jgi:hypothetical protein
MDNLTAFHYLNPMKTLILTLVTLTLARAAPIAPSPEPTTATEAVFFSMGMVEAQGEILTATIVEAAKIAHPAPLIPPPFPFRLMASMARQMAWAFSRDGLFLAYWYFTGRAEVFEQMGDMVGEPPL